MSIFDLFTNNVAEQAAQDQIAGLNQGYGLASNNLQQAIQALQQQYGLGQSSLSNQSANARNEIFGGYNNAFNQINTGTNNAAGALTGNYTAALQPFLQNYNQATQGTTQLANALGLNGGAAGADAAAAAYASNPAFQFQLNQGNQNVLRNSAQTGTTASGATLNALQQQGQGLANSTYQQYVQNLMPFLGQANTAASGIGNIYTGLGSSLGNLYSSQGNNLANLATGAGSSLASIDQSLGSGQANLFTGLGQGLAQQYGNLANLGWQFGTGVGNANANATLAQNQANANQLGFLGNLLGGGLNFLGQSGGTGGPGAAMAMLSDARLKDDIGKVGELYDGTGVYRFRYKWDDPKLVRVGLMAQEVEQTNPEAVHDVGGGVKAVDYGKATDAASMLARFVEPANDDSPRFADSLERFLKAA